MRKVLLFLLLSCCISLVYADEIEWTDDELAFIAEHPIINIGVDPDFQPFEFIDSDGVYKGIAKDYIDIIERRTGLKFVVAKDLTWSQAYEKAVERELDVLPSISFTKERERYFLFSHSYYQFQRIIVMAETNETVKDYKDLFGKTVAVQRNSSHHSLLKSYPEINLSFYASPDEALLAVSNGTEDYFVGNLATNNYIMKKNGITNLSYVTFDAGEENTLHFAIRQDWPELQSILNKVLDSITEEEELTIYNKWIDVEYRNDYQQLFRVIMIVGGLILIIASVSIFWISRLKSEIKKRIQTEKDLKIAKAEAESANAVKSNFIARMSHEIRTPLNAITGLGYLMLNTELTTQQKEHMEKLNNATDTMMSIVNDILDISKIEAGKLDIEEAPFELDEVIANTLNVIAFRAEEKQLNLTLTKNPKLPNYFLGDKVRLGQILLNLTNNAIKFTEAGDIALDFDLTGYEDKIYHLKITISDTGIGIKASHLDKLFKPFTQEDASITRRYGGTGLGLSITKNLVELMGGSIAVESTVGEGTSFIVSLKLKLDEVKENEVKKGFEYIKDIRTLVLNSDMNSLSLIISYLKSFSITAQFTSSENQFKQLINQPQQLEKMFDLLIVYEDDINDEMPVFIESIRNTNNTVPKVIWVCHPSHHSCREDAYEDVTCLQIPFLPSMLYGCISKLFKFRVLASQSEVPAVDLRREKLTGRVLVVEDNMTNQMIAKELLSPLGLSIDQAYNGQEAIDMVNAQKYDLLLMDLHMPVMNGLEATTIIRQTHDMPIVAMTADAIEGVKEECLIAGMNDFISKPFVPKRFIARVASYFNQDRPIESERIVDIQKGITLLGNKPDLYHQVCEMFLKENTQTLESLEKAIATHDYAQAAGLIHKVKSSAGNIGADSVRKTANILQNALEAEEREKISRTFTLFHQQFEKVILELNTYLKYKKGR